MIFACVPFVYIFSTRILRKLHAQLKAWNTLEAKSQVKPPSKSFPYWSRQPEIIQYKRSVTGYMNVNNAYGHMICLYQYPRIFLAINSACSNAPNKRSKASADVLNNANNKHPILSLTDSQRGCSSLLSQHKPFSSLP